MIDEMGVQRWASVALTVEMAKKNSLQNNLQYMTWKNFVVKRVMYDTIGGRIVLHLASSAISDKTFPETIFDPHKCKSLIQFRSVYARHLSCVPDFDEVKAIKKKNRFDELSHLTLQEALEEAKNKVLSLV